MRGGNQLLSDPAPHNLPGQPRSGFGGLALIARARRNINSSVRLVCLHLHWHLEAGKLEIVASPKPDGTMIQMQRSLSLPGPAHASPRTSKTWVEITLLSHHANLFPFHKDCILTLCISSCIPHHNAGFFTIYYPVASRKTWRPS